MLFNPNLLYWTSPLSVLWNCIKKKKKKEKNRMDTKISATDVHFWKARDDHISPPPRHKEHTVHITGSDTIYRFTKNRNGHEGRLSGQFTIRQTHKTGCQDKTLGNTIVWHKRVTNDSRFITFIFFLLLFPNLFDRFHHLLTCEIPRPSLSLPYISK